MDEGGERLFLFVRRNIRRHKQHLPQSVPAGGRPCQCQVSAMDWVEAAAEEADIHSDIPRDFPAIPRYFRRCRSLWQLLVKDRLRTMFPYRRFVPASFAESIL